MKIWWKQYHSDTDLGHTPFGHCGEGVLNELVEGGFHHNLQSVRVVEVLEDLNLCRRNY